MAIAPLVITAPLKLPLSIKNSDALQANGPPSVLPTPLLGVQTVSLVNGAEKVLTLRPLTRTDVKQLTTNALQELLDLSLVLLDSISMLQLVEIPVVLALLVSTVQE